MFGHDLPINNQKTDAVRHERNERNAVFHRLGKFQRLFGTLDIVREDAPGGLVGTVEQLLHLG